MPAYRQVYLGIWDLSFLNRSYFLTQYAFVAIIFMAVGYSSSIDSQAECKDDILAEQQVQSKITTLVLAMFFTSLLGVGMGQTAVYTLGIPYIDDNVASRESPLYFAITIGIRILGPALGFILGSFCTR